jgi:hypothetical protein
MRIPFVVLFFAAPMMVLCVSHTGEKVAQGAAGREDIILSMKQRALFGLVSTTAESPSPIWNC